MTNELKQAIGAYCERLTAAVDHPDISFHCDGRGKKYLRIVRRSWGSDSAHAFVKVDDGSLWKPASWKGPAKNFSRGNVFSLPEVVTEYHGR